MIAGLLVISTYKLYHFYHFKDKGKLFYRHLNSICYAKIAKRTTHFFKIEVENKLF